MTIQVGDGAANPVFTDVVQQAQSLGSLNATNTIQLRGQACATVQVTGIGSLTLTFEGTTDGTNFDAIVGTPIAGGTPVSTTTTNGHWVNINVIGLFAFRVRVSAYTSGTATVSAIASQGAPGFASYATGGGERVDLASVNGTALGTPTNFGSTPGAVVAASVNSSAFIGTTVAVAASAGVQKVGISGNAGASVDAVSGAAVPANALLVAGGSIAGGTNTTPVTVKAASTAAAATDTSLVVQPLVGSAVMSTAAAGVQKVGIVGNTGATLDAANGAAVSTNGQLVGGGSIAGGTNFTVLTVKAASTAAAATDTSLVVQPLVGSAVMSTAAAGVQKVGIVGNAGAAFDAVSGAAVPANALIIAGGSVAGGTNTTVATVKAASVAAAVTDTSLVVQLIAGTAALRSNQTTTAAGAVDVNVVGSLGVTNAATNGSFVRLTDNTTAITAAVSALGTAPTGTAVQAVNNTALPNASAGAACTLFQSSAVTTAVVVKASAGNIYGFMVNGGTSGNFLQFINASSAPVLGTAAVFSVQIPASGVVFAPPAALAMVNNATGISAGISTTYNGASAGTAASVIIFYK